MLFHRRKSLLKGLFIGVLCSVCLLIISYWRSEDTKLISTEQYSVNTPKYSDLSRCEFNSSGFDCPDIRHLGRTSARQAQLVLTRMLKIFDLIAKKHKLRYWLSFGTLLGAVRHGGYNPFDKGLDLDIAILRADFDKFLNIAALELPSDIFLQTKQTDSNWSGVRFSNLLAKLRDNKSCYKYCINHGCKFHDGLQVDIFAIEQYQGYLLEYCYMSKFMRFLMDPLYRPYTDVFPLKQMEFDGFQFPVPKRWDKVLTSFYNDYKKVPSDIPQFTDIEVSHSCQEVVESTHSRNT